MHQGEKNLATGYSPLNQHLFLLSVTGEFMRVGGKKIFVKKILKICYEELSQILMKLLKTKDLRVI